MQKIIAFILTLIGAGTLITQQEFVDFRPEISTGLSKVIMEAPVVVPDDEPDDIPKPDPDPAKCACRGTGVITHKDGHATPCPYHARQEESVTVTEEECLDGSCSTTQYSSPGVSYRRGPLGIFRWRIR